MQCFLSFVFPHLNNYLSFLIALCADSSSSPRVFLLQAKAYAKLGDIAKARKSADLAKKADTANEKYKTEVNAF